MLSLLDNIAIGIFAILVVGIGYYFSKKQKNMEDYYLAGKSLPWSLVVGTLFATWYGAGGFVGFIGYAATYGFAAWTVWCVVAHAVRIPLALYVGPKAHVRTDLSIPDLIESLYGKKAAIIAAIFMFCTCVCIGDVLASGKIASVCWGLDIVVGAAIIVTVTCLIAALGGLMGVAITDMIMFASMLIFGNMIIPGLFNQVGGFAGITKVFEQNGIMDMLHPTKGMDLYTMVNLVVLSFGAYADPAFYQRFSAADSAKTARRALLTCFPLWITFDMLNVFMGLIVAAMKPGMDPEVAYFQIALGALPAGIRGLFIVGILGSIISTMDSYYLIGGSTIINDIFIRIKGKEYFTEKQKLLYTKIAVFFMGALGLGLAFRFKLIFDGVIWINSINYSVIFIPVLFGLLYNGKKTEFGGLCTMAAGFITFEALKFAKFSLVPPLLVSYIVSTIVYLIANQYGEDRSQNGSLVND